MAHTNGHVNGVSKSDAIPDLRFSTFPNSIAVPVGQDEEVEIDLQEVPDEYDELCSLLEAERAKGNIWMTIASAYAKHEKIDIAIEILNRGLGVVTKHSPQDRIALSTLQCWFYLGKSRSAPRQEIEGAGLRTKNEYLGLANMAMSAAWRTNPAVPYTPLLMARGVLSLLKASLAPPGKMSGPHQLESGERVGHLKDAMKNFEDVLKVSGQRNLLAVAGKARVQFALGKFQEALALYQDVLSRGPDHHEPDPRIGIGCCLWHLNHPEEAKMAWERALEVNPRSKIAHILLGLYYLRDSSKHDPLTPEFAASYRAAIAQHTQKAYEMDNNDALASVTLGGHFVPKLAMKTVEELARKAIDFGDAFSVVSDGWYLLARKEHYQQDKANLRKLLDLYNRADSARGGGARGFLLAKFGAAQAQILQNDIEGARFRLEGIIQHHQNVVEAKVILGTIYAQEFLEAQAAGSKEDKTDVFKKAVAHLEAVRFQWRENKSAIKPDPNVLILLSKLFASESPDKALGCLLQLESWEIEKAPASLKFEDEEDLSVRRTKQREHLAPELLNNIACFQYQLERYNEASETFQSALSACTKMTGDNNTKTDELVTSISYNLARSYEGSQLPGEARKVYEGLLERHPEYSDARTRLTYIQFQADSGDVGQKAMESLYEAEPNDLEVRALFGWFIRHTKKYTANLAEDAEWKHYKNTLQNFDKHDTYSLMGMGNLHLMLAREMKRMTDEERARRHRQYQKAVEFFHKVLDLDPKNAFAAQGVAIALAEDKKDAPGAKQILSRVRETLRDSDTLVNLGHVDMELKQFPRAIESYESALAMDRQEDTQLLACLGRTWFYRARQEKSTAAFNSALELSRRTLRLAPDQVHFQFNVAFVQQALAQHLRGVAENFRTKSEMEEALKGVDEANDVFSELAKADHPPYPPSDLDARANLGKTIRSQLEREIQKQGEYENANAERLAAAREARDKQLKEREQEKKKREEEEADRQAKLAEERAQLLDVSRRLAEDRAAEEKRREEAEYTDNSEGERVKRVKKPKKKGEGKRRKRASTLR